MPLPQNIKQAIHDNPEIALVLEIAARAREIDERTPPQELRASTEVAALPLHAQHGVMACLEIPTTLGCQTQRVWF